MQNTGSSLNEVKILNTQSLFCGTVFLPKNSPCVFGKSLLPAVHTGIYAKSSGQDDGHCNHPIALTSR